MAHATERAHARTVCICQGFAPAVAGSSRTTQADLEAYLPPPVAAMLYEAFAYSDQYG